MMTKATSFLTAGALAMASLAVSVGGAKADGRDFLAFPAEFEKGVHYGTVERGGITEELYTSREAIDAAKQGEPFPSGTVITLVDYRNGGIHRYVIMEKRGGWGEHFPKDVRTGDWRFQEFRPDGTVNKNEDGTRCMSCHKPQAANDFVFTVDLMKDD